MAKDNIYDITTSEIIMRLRSTETNSAATARLEISSNLGFNTVPVGYNAAHNFTSGVVNMPTGYTVKVSTHIITMPIAPISVISSNSISTATNYSVNIGGTVGATFVVSSTVTLEHASDPDLILTDTYTVTSVLPICYGVKVYDVSPTISTLSTQSSDALSFNLTTTILGRLLIAIPTGDDDLIALQDSNGNVWPVSDFTMTTVTDHEIWQLNYDTQFTGAYIKTLTIKTV